MIPDLELKEFARKNGVPLTTIERDYAQNWLLIFLSKKLKMALKGGTGLRKAYIPNYRFSDDLDFTMLENIGAESIKNTISKAKMEARKESGIDFEENFRFNKNVNGYESVIYFRIIRRTGSPLKIKIDLTRKENEIIVLRPINKKIIHPYSDDCKGEVQVYSIEEIFSEKVRALFQRTRPRDLYDVWYLLKYGLKASEIISKKLKFKNVEVDIGDLSRRKEVFKNAWETSLKHQLTIIPDFDESFHNVSKFLDDFIKH